MSEINSRQVIFNLSFLECTFYLLKDQVKIWFTFLLKLYFNTFLLSEHMLCKESIVIVKKLDFEVLTYLYVFRSPEFLYTIFKMMYVCLYVYVCVCSCVYVRMWVNTIASKRCTRLSSNLVCILQVAVRRTPLIFVNIRILIHYGLQIQNL